MKKLLLLLLLSSPCLAAGPKHSFSDPLLNDELQNVYFDQANTFKKTIPSATFTSISVSTITASSATITNATITNLEGKTSSTSVDAGIVGEIKTSATTWAAAIAHSAGQTIDVATITVTAGCWQVNMTAGAKATNAATAYTFLIYALNTSPNAFPSSDYIGVQDTTTGVIYMERSFASVVPGNTNSILEAGPTVDFCISSPATYYLVTLAGVGVSTSAMFGSLRARRYL